MINWELGNTCNYTCSYCPKQLHDGSRYWPADEAVLRFADRLVSLSRPSGRTVHIQFTGGEVTLMPRLRSLLEGLHGLGCRVSVISNGSRSIRWWKESSRYLDAAILTFHPEAADIVHFERVTQLLSSCIRTHVNVAAPPTMFEYALEVADRLSQSCSDITLLLKPLLIEFGEQLYPYSHEQLEILSTRQFQARLTRPYYDPRGDMVVTYDDGASARRGPSTFIADGSNNWRGWECDIGLELLSINMWGEIYRGLCSEGGQLGHFSQPELFDLPRAPVICTRDSCSCLLDIMTSRRRNEKVASPQS